MRKIKYIISAALILPAICALVSHISSHKEYSYSDGVHAFAIGPGLDNLSLGDSFATWQWGLKNDGEFRLTQMWKNFPSAGNELGASPDQSQSGTVSIPNVIGPGAYESSVTDAVTGVDINIRPAWNLYDKADHKRQVIIAVIDTGIDYMHPELTDAMWVNPGEIPGDGIDNDGNGYIDDIYGWNFYHDTNQVYTGYEDSHGTHAAGTIAAVRGEMGIAGIADTSYVKVMSLKALGGIDGSGTVEDVVEAIRYAEANGASICNLSFGTDLYDARLEEAIQSSNMLFVIAAGNGDANGMGYNTDESPVYPSSFPSDRIISVANLLFDGRLSASSNYGAVSVDIAAPGSYILSTLTDSQYGFMSGTSMAAPMVTGTAAMLYSYRPEITLDEVRQILLQTARTMDDINGKVATGGMLDACAALNMVP